MPQLSTEKRARIFTFLEEGYSSRFIATKENVHRSTVLRIHQRKEETGSFENKPKSGRPRVLSVHTERQILRLVASNQCSTAIDIQKQLQNFEKIKVSADTIRRTLRRNGLVSRIKKKKPYLRKMHRIRRLAFARKYQNWTLDDWKRVVWSDESKFMLFGSDGRLYCWKKPDEPLRSPHVKPTVKFGVGSIMVWGCFTSHGTGNLCRIEGGLDGELYRRILAEDFMETLSDLGLGVEDVIFQHDNDPKHTANLTKDWLSDNGVVVLDWPAQSPDLNPIEHLWNEAERRLRHLPTRATGKEDLWDKLQDVWNGIEADVCLNLIESMPERVNDVIKAKGGYTRW
jgi:transposase